MKDLVLASLAAFTLAACGGSGSAVVEDVVTPEVDNGVQNEEDAAPVQIVLAPANGNLGPNNISFAQSASGIEVFVTIDGETQSFSGITAALEELGLTNDLDSRFNIVAGTDLTALVAALNGSSAENGLDIALALVGGTDATAASVGVLLSQDPESNDIADATVTAGAAFSRLTDTTLPLTGSATYEGDYVSILLPNDLAASGLNTQTLAIEGTARLSADFANAVISGDITERDFIALEQRDPQGATVSLGLEVSRRPDQLADITLAETAIDDAGAFAGIASADNSILNSEEAFSTDGAFSGLIAGATGDEVVGAVTLTHVTDGQSFTELGSFAAQ